MFERGKYDNLVFLSLAYIRVERKAAEVCYEEVLSDSGCSPIKVKAFDDLMEEFSEVEIRYYGSLSYIHPSYKDAFGFALTDDGKPNNICKKIFSSVLLNLSEKDEVAWSVARAVAENFDKLPEDVKSLLDKLQGQLQCVIKDSLMRDKIGAIRLISNVRTKIDKGFALKILNRLSKDKDKKVKTEAKALKSSHPFNSS